MIRIHLPCSLKVCLPGIRPNKIKVTTDAKDLGQNALASDLVSSQGFTTVYAEKLSAGHLHICSKMNNQSAYCWGFNLSGLMGIGEADYFITEPTASLFSDIDSIFALYANTCSLNTAGQIHCVGEGTFGGIYGEPVEYSLVPLHLDKLNRVTRIDAGRSNVCVFEETGNVKC